MGISYLPLFSFQRSCPLKNGAQYYHITHWLGNSIPFKEPFGEKKRTKHSISKGRKIYIIILPMSIGLAETKRLLESLYFP